VAAGLDHLPERAFRQVVRLLLSVLALERAAEGISRLVGR